MLFWVVWDAEKAALEVEYYRIAIARAAQAALREIIGLITLAEILIGRAVMYERTAPWGISVQSVEVSSVIIPQELEDANSQQALVERERQSRVILGKRKCMWHTASLKPK